MNCKPGDMAVIVRAERFPELLGRVLQVTKVLREESALYGEPHWDTAEPIYVNDPRRCGRRGRVCIADSSLRPIRDPGDDAVDETLLKLPAPTKEVEHA